MKNLFGGIFDPSSDCDDHDNVSANLITCPTICLTPEKTFDLWWKQIEAHQIN